MADLGREALLHVFGVFFLVVHFFVLRLFVLVVVFRLLFVVVALSFLLIVFGLVFVVLVTTRLTEGADAGLVFAGRCEPLLLGGFLNGSVGLFIGFGGFGLELGEVSRLRLLQR